MHRLFGTAISLLITLLCFSETASAQKISLASRLSESGSYYQIHEQFRYKNDCYFTTYSRKNGTVLYRIDSVSGAVSFVYHWPLTSTNGNHQMSPVVYKGELWFVQTDTAGSEIWHSDGTTAGTTRLTDFQPGPRNGVFSGHYGLQELNGELHFLAFGPNYLEGMLGKTDGTLAGTTGTYRMPYTGSNEHGPFLMLPAVNGQLRFIGGELPGRIGFYLSDGTQQGTRESFQAFLAHQSAIWNDRIFMSPWNVDTIFSTDGSSNTVVLTGASIGSDYFATKDGMYFFSGVTLYRSDGTASGTRAVFKERFYSGVRYGNRLFEDYAHSYASHNGDLFFVSDTTVYQYREATRQLRQVHKFMHQNLLHEIGDIYRNIPFGLTWFAGKLYLKALYWHRLELYELDPASGAVRMVRSGDTSYRSPFVNTISISPTLTDPMIVCNNRLYYTAGYDSSIGVALYKLEYPTLVAETAQGRNALRLTPNPAAGIVKLSLPGNATLLYITVTDPGGRVVMRREGSNRPGTSVDLSALPAGVYTIAATTDIGTLCGQLSVQH